MSTYIALLRAVNVGGTGKLAMADLTALCAALGYRRIETYIASGNVVFDCGLASKKVESQLEKALSAHTGKSVDVFVRSADEMRQILKKNPFSDREPRLTHSLFLRDRPNANALKDLRGQAGEELRLGEREIYVYYPLGAGQSKLRIAAAKICTSRNLNTVAKLVEMSSRT